MEELIEYRRRLLDRYEQVAAELAQLLNQIPVEDRRKPLANSRWSPHHLAAHLRNVESQTFLPHFRRLLGKNGPGSEHSDSAVWTDENYDPNEPLQEILQVYARMRLQELEWLQSMPAEGWSRTDRHPVFGLRTLQWWVERSLAHAGEHLIELKKNAGENRQ